MERLMGRNRKMVSKRRIGAMYVKRAMREIASCLTMTVETAMTVEADNNDGRQIFLTFNS